MSCYRFFKELRNSIIHRGGVADPLVCSAYSSFSTLTTVNLGLRQIPEHEVPIPGAQIHLSLRGVVAFSEVILRIIATLDTELSRAAASEKEFLSQWKEINGRGVTLKADLRDRQGQIERLVRKLDLPTPTETGKIESLLRLSHLLG